MHPSNSARNPPTAPSKEQLRSEAAIALDALLDFPEAMYNGNIDVPDEVPPEHLPLFVSTFKFEAFVVASFLDKALSGKDLVEAGMFDLDDENLKAAKRCYEFVLSSMQPLATLVEDAQQRMDALKQQISQSLWTDHLALGRLWLPRSDRVGHSR